MLASSREAVSDMLSPTGLLDMFVCREAPVNCTGMQYACSFACSEIISRKVRLLLLFRYHVGPSWRHYLYLCNTQRFLLSISIHSFAECFIELGNKDFIDLTTH